MGLIKTVAAWVWNACPTWMKFYLAFITVPNLACIIVIFFLYVIPFIDGRIHAVINPRKEARDQQTMSLIQMETVRYQALREDMSQLNQQQSIMYAEMIRRQNNN